MVKMVRTGVTALLAPLVLVGLVGIRGNEVLAAIRDALARKAKRGAKERKVRKVIPVQLDLKVMPEPKERLVQKERRDPKVMRGLKVMRVLKAMLVQKVTQEKKVRLVQKVTQEKKVRLVQKETLGQKVIPPFPISQTSMD
jgi:hypothetical protein